MDTREKEIEKLKDYKYGFQLILKVLGLQKV